MTIAKPIFNFCERGVQGLISEPASALSMLPTLFLALMIFNDLKNKFNLKLFFFGLSVLYIAMGSGLMHTSNIFITRILDGSAMILFISYITLTLQKSNTIGVSIFIIYNLIANLFLFTNPPFALFLFVLNSVYLMTKIFFIKKSKSDLVKSIVIFGIGFLFWLSDSTRIWCNPNNHLITGHALWHIFITIGIYFIYKYYKSEQNRA